MASHPAPSEIRSLKSALSPHGHLPAGSGKLPAATLEEYRGARSDGPAKCTWYTGMSDAERGADPHKHKPRAPRPKILDSVLQAIGDTPLVRINALARAEGIECELLAKCEYFNAGGSVKDRIGLRMVEDAEASGRIKPGDTLIEPTSGNTGIGIALAAALKGYRCIITLPEKMSSEKVDVLKALGAEIIRTPTEAAWDSPESHIGVARRLQATLPNAHILDQYTNPSNPLAHYDGTAEEIWAACDGRLDMVILTAGTGGTLTGVARRLKELNPAVVVVGVDPRGSILAEPDALNDERRLQSYLIEGIGYDFVPAVLDRSLVDFWVKTNDRESFITARRLIREEGLLVGGSAGAAMAGALQAARTLKAGQRAVVLLADGVRNYMSKFLSDDWMWRAGFSDPEHGIGVADAADPRAGQWWASRTVNELSPPAPLTVAPSVTAGDAARLMLDAAFDQLPVVDESNAILGVVTEGNLTARLTAGRIKPGDPVTKALYAQFRTVTLGTRLAELARIFDRDHFAVVVQTQRCYTGGGGGPAGAAGMSERSLIVGLVTRIDLLRYITNAPEGASAASTPVAGCSGSPRPGAGAHPAAAAAAPATCPVPH